jgi:tRNA 2-thiouridine synthesizing protein E
LTEHTLEIDDTKISDSCVADRSTELSDQGWDREKSAALAKSEGIDLSDEHWAVIVFLRQYYIEHGLPENGRTTAKALSKHFSDQGGTFYLDRLFARGPVEQGSRLANLRTPAFSHDPVFGASY